MLGLKHQGKIRHHPKNSEKILSWDQSAQCLRDMEKELTTEFTLVFGPGIPQPVQRPPTNF